MRDGDKNEGKISRGPNQHLRELLQREIKIHKRLMKSEELINDGEILNCKKLNFALTHSLS